MTVTTLNHEKQLLAVTVLRSVQKKTPWGAEMTDFVARTHDGGDILRCYVKRPYDLRPGQAVVIKGERGTGCYFFADYVVTNSPAPEFPRYMTAGTPTKQNVQF